MGGGVKFGNIRGRGSENILGCGSGKIPTDDGVVNVVREFLVSGVFQYVARRTYAQGCSAPNHTHCSVRPQPW
jgi:hypothetical protein